ncbi:MAG: beta-galactosidase [Chitinivibrionales bacterium]|nr:beta-galactosidase [Chitinivibrionales bacterium]
MAHHGPLCAKAPHMLHGGDYNPDQWEHYPGVWDEDMRLMKLAHCNAMSVGIFSWAALEPEEGTYTFDWLDRVMDMLAENDAYAVLATPSGARPAWMSQKYPEVLRVQANQQRILHGGRHNHCYTSPVYREKVAAINTKLAERYKDHPALILWHLSNEYGGACYCELCRQAFREWLQTRYETLDKLNDAWWTRFWAHTYTDWSQVDAPMPHGEGSVLGMHLDWRRFVTSRHTDFCRHEAQSVKAVTPDIPVTTNLMGTYPGINYRELADVLDVVSWDNYPRWHASESDIDTAVYVSMMHHLNRSLKHGKPFLLMESTPSTTNWMPQSKLKRPGMHLLSSLQAVAHGSDSVQYFQWRKSRGAAEQHHGAVVDHCGHENTRVFRDVAEVGSALEKLDDVVGSEVGARVALIYDWEARWAIDDCNAITNDKRDYDGTCREHYRPFWERGIAVDVIGMDDDLDGYDTVIAPMLYLVRPGFGQRIEQFVRAGGTFVSTYWSGIVNETANCFLGGFPGPLRSVLGIWSEEIDTLYEYERNEMVMNEPNTAGLNGSYEAHTLCDLVHPEGAEVVATYGRDFYRGRPALTVNSFGKGQAWYIAARTEQRFLDDLYGMLTQRLELPRAVESDLPEGVTAAVRGEGDRRHLFLMNFGTEPKSVSLDSGRYVDVLTGAAVDEQLKLPRYGVAVLRSR